MNEPCIALMPSADGRYDGLTMRGVVQVTADRLLNQVYQVCGNSNIQSAREDCAHFWLTKTSYDWAVWIDSDIGFSAEDWELLWSGDDEAVCGTYPRKSQTRIAMVEWGMGFARVSRKLMQHIAEMRYEENGEYLAARYGAYGEERIEYFPQGARVLEHQSLAEDLGFWTLAKMTGLPVRLETRLRLLHRGAACWRTPGPGEHPLTWSKNDPSAPDLTER